MAEAETKSVADVLREARRLIEKPEAWTQGAESRNEAGESIEMLDSPDDDTDPVCWCAGGAIWELPVPAENKIAASVLLASIVNGTDDRFTIPHWNDDPSRTHAEVLAAFDAAIARAEEAQ